MKNLTLVIPAKEESESLPSVLKEVKNLGIEILIVLEPDDFDTIVSVKKYNSNLIYQSASGYGDAIIQGIKNVKTKYLCIFNADGSFDYKSLKEMQKICHNLDFVFGSRYIKGGGSEDDTLLTKIGNFIFTKIGKIFFSLNNTDILYTYILGKKVSFEKLDLKSKDFSICVEIPIKAKRMKMNCVDIPSYERKRKAGKKKVNEFKDGFKIFLYMLKSFFKITT